jgi:hypothetical protein
MRLFAYSNAANRAATTPAIRLGSENKGLVKRLTAPPKRVDVTAKYGPSKMPIIGANIVDAVIVLKRPTIWNMGTKERTTYTAVKHAVKATSFAVSLLVIDIL